MVDDLYGVVIAVQTKNFAAVDVSMVAQARTGRHGAEEEKDFRFQILDFRFQILKFEI